MNKNIIQTLKIISFGLVLSAGFALAQIFTGPFSNPPSVNIPAPINDSSYGQIKSGGLGVGPLTVFGDSAFYGKQSILTSGNLYASNKAGVGILPTASSENLEIANTAGLNGQGDIKNYMKTSSLSLASNPSPSKIREVCSDSSGKLVLCAITAATSVAHGSKTWNINGGYSFTVPHGISSLVIETWGAGAGGAGGTGAYGSDGIGVGGNGGGGGGYAKTTITVAPNQVMNITVGERGVYGTGSGSDGFGATSGGFGTDSFVLSNGNLILKAYGGQGQSPGTGVTSPGGGFLAGPGITGTNGQAGLPAGTGTGFGTYGGTGGYGANGGAGGSGGGSPTGNSGNGSDGLWGNSGIAPGGGGQGGGGADAKALYGYSGGGGGYGADGQVRITW